MSTNLSLASSHVQAQAFNPLALMARVKSLRQYDDETVDGTPRRHWSVFIALLICLGLGLAVVLYCAAWSTPASLPDAEAAEIYE